MQPGGVPGAPGARVRALDGLRGAAVVAVLLFHSGHLIGGYLGVDLFFTLSGFLITGLLLSEWDGTREIRLLSFWARRARRLLPALFLMLAGVAAYAAFVALPVQLDTIRGDALATLGYAANWHSIAAGHSYWSLFGAPSPLNHTWSLAIEEQFYLLWPLIVVALAATTRRRDRLPSRVLAVSLTGAAVLGALAVFLATSGSGGDRVYLGTDTRAPAILLGAALAAALAWRPPPRSTASRVAIELAGVGGIAWLAWAWTHLDGQDPFLGRGGLLLCAVAAVLVIVATVHPRRGPAAAALSFAPLVWLGLISYGLYLWHWPVYVWLDANRAGVDGWALTGLRVGLSVSLAVASYFFVEMPIRRGALRGWRIRVAAATAVSVTLVVVLLTTAGGVEPSSTVEVSRPTRSVAATAASSANGAPRVLVVGDSVGTALGARLEEVQQQAGIATTNRGEVGCEIATSDFRRKPAGIDGPGSTLIKTTAACHDWPARLSADLDQVHPDIALLHMGFPAVYDIEVQSAWHTACSPWWNRSFTAQATFALRILGSSGAQVWVSTIPRPGADFFPASLGPAIDCGNRALRDAAKAAHASVIDIAGYICPGTGACGHTLDGQELRPDGLHYDGPGGRLLAAWVAGHLTQSWRGRAGASPVPATNATFCSVLSRNGTALEVLTGAATRLREEDASQMAGSLRQAITTAPRDIRSAGLTLVRAYERMAKGGPVELFATGEDATAAATFLTYYSGTCGLHAVRTAADRRAKTAQGQKLLLTFGGAVNATFSTPQASDECTVSNDRTRLACSLVPKGSHYRIDFVLVPYAQPGTFEIAPVSDATLSVQQFDDALNLAGKYTATSGRIAIERADVEAGPFVALNDTAVGSIDVMVAPTFHSSSVSGDPIHVVGTFSCPLRGSAG